VIAAGAGAENAPNGDVETTDHIGFAPTSRQRDAQPRSSILLMLHFERLRR